MDRAAIEAAMVAAGLADPRTMIHKLRKGDLALIMFAGPTATRKSLRIGLDRMCRARSVDVTAAIEKLKEMVAA